MPMPVIQNPSGLSKKIAPKTFRHLAALRVPPASSQNRLQLEIMLLLSLLQTMATRQPYLLGHGDRTASYALLLGKTVGLQAADLIHLHYAALLHDIGQLTLPDELLKKSGPLTAEEYELVQSHPRAGAELLEPISFLETPALWIAHHHERWDGSGYPYGLRGSFIPLGSRILAVADTFDALTSDHSYRTEGDLETALGLLQMVAGSQLDPELVQAFVQLAPTLTRIKAARFSIGHDPVHGAGCASRPRAGRRVPPGPPPTPLSADASLEGFSETSKEGA
jgi:HD-GYP domain-containing protein (c-di-GMP phosphodiesterase class II)